MMNSFCFYRHFTTVCLIVILCAAFGFPSFADAKGYYGAGSSSSNFYRNQQLMRRQQAQVQRQQADQVRRQQEVMRRQQAEQMRRQQEAMRRQQEAMRRQQEAMRQRQVRQQQLQQQRKTAQQQKQVKLQQKRQQNTQGNSKQFALKQKQLQQRSLLREQQKIKVRKDRLAKLQKDRLAKIKSGKQSKDTKATASISSIRKGAKLASTNTASKPGIKSSKNLKEFQKKRALQLKQSRTTKELEIQRKSVREKLQTIAKTKERVKKEKEADLKKKKQLTEKQKLAQASFLAYPDARKFWTNKVEFKGNKVYQRNDLIDIKLKDGRNRTNLERMKKGLAPIGPDGKPLNLHHMTQRHNGPIAEVSQTFHQKNSRIIHINPSTTQSGIDRDVFNKWRSNYWQERAKYFQ